MTAVSHLTTVKLAHQAKDHLRAAGWSYRTAATELGVTYQHVCYVLNGQRHSASLLQKIIHLPVRKAKQKLTKSHS